MSLGRMGSRDGWNRFVTYTSKLENADVNNDVHTPIVSENTMMREAMLLAWTWRGDGDNARHKP